MKKLIVIVLIAMFSFSAAQAGSLEDYEKYIKQKQEIIKPPVKNVSDGYNLDWLWEFIGTKKDKAKAKARQKQQEYLNRANDALKQLQK